MARPAVGLIVNPVAGIGGKVGLKGSDGEEIQRKARALGATPEAGRRASIALTRLAPIADRIELVACPAEMGARAAQAAGHLPSLVGSIRSALTTAEDTKRAAGEMAQMGVRLLLFAGGDGTARDIYDAVGSAVPALGIPAGVKIHSAAFAINPAAAGDLAAAFLSGSVSRLREAEVMDLDEEAVRSGRVAPRLYGYLKIPVERMLTQGSKVASAASEASSMAAIAAAIVDHMEDECIYILGPGTTTRAITDRLELPKTLVGVDAIANRRIAAMDANEAQILELIQGRRAKIIVTPIGGQGCVFGRGNQPISADVIAQVGRQNIIIVSTPQKIHALENRPLWVDTGNPEMDKMLSGYVRVVTGYGEEAVVRISC